MDKQFTFGNTKTNQVLRRKVMDTTALTLVTIGAINWGLIALFRFDLVATIFGGQDAFLSRVVYGLVG